MRKIVLRREDLLRLYVVERRTQKEVAHILHTSCEIVRRNLNECRIPIRGRGEEHGMSHTPPYISWQSMKDRCSNPRNKSYRWYGGCGIKYAERWVSFMGFWEDMGPSYIEGMTLDRIDSAKGYSKENCRWVPRSEQNRNKLNNVLLTVRGQTKCVAEWAEELDLNVWTLYKRVAAGWADKKVLTVLTQRPEIRERDSSGRFLSAR